MRETSQKSYFFQGVRDAAPFMLVIAPFSLLFGVVATEAGLNVLETMGFSIIVIAGAAQFAAVGLMEDNVPTLIIILTALAVNLRMAMYSASLQPYLGKVSIWRRAVVSYFMVDQAYACSILKYEAEQAMTPSQRFTYYMGTVTPICPLWYALTLVGAVLGSQIPPEYALDFALPITFIAMIAPALRTPAHIIAAFTSVIGALVFSGIPNNLGLIVAAFLAMLAGAQTELWMERRK